MSIYKTWAPRCAMPDCNDSVGYHSSKLKNDGTRAYKWKSFCDHHRTVGKAARDLFLKSRGGCENRDGRAGFICKWPDSPSLTLDHWDGNKHNNDESNLVVLCANCHNEKSKRAGDTRIRYHNVSRMFYDLFQEES